MKPTASIPHYMLIGLLLSVSSVATALYLYNDGFQTTFEYLSDFRSRERLPDFSRHRQIVYTMNEQEWNTEEGRVVIIGDLHGMIQPLRELLSEIKYQPSADTLVHVGDIITKGTRIGSLDMLSFMTTHNVTGVRGNHDQKVIEWRTWIEWISGLPGGRKWLKTLRRDWAKVQDTEPEPEEWLKRKKRRDPGDKKWWKRIPKGWTLFSEHFTIAYDMSDEHYQYLLDLPLVLHAPSAHAYIVHGGILPSDPTRKPSHPKQPLAHIPKMSKSSYRKKGAIKLLRGLQEAAVLSVVPQNQDPWGLMNMRSLTRRGEVIRNGNIGQPWPEYWNNVINRCNGFQLDKSSHRTIGSVDPLPCYPSTVIYGHTASRGLDPRRWSIGLDSGCVHGRHLTALVLGKPAPNENLRRGHRVPFGDKGHGRLYSIKCR